MPEQLGEKTQPATPHRRQKAREEGHVSKSHDLSSAMLLIGTVIGLMALGEKIGEFMLGLTNRHLGGEAWLSIDTGTMVQEMLVIIFGLAEALLPILGLMVLLAVVVNVAQTGFLFLPNKLSFDLQRINPTQGIKRIVSISGLMRLTFGLLKVLIVTAVAYWVVWSEFQTILKLANFEIREMTAFLFELLCWTVIKIGGALLFLALLDYAFQRWKYERDLRMTPQEVHEEIKNLQGDPQISARRRTVQRHLALNRISSAVTQADVIVTNPTELAIAVQYDPQSMVAPVVVSKGAGAIAQRIRRLALENDIPVVEKKELARSLYQHLEVGQTIPTEQYTAIAEVLRYVYQLTGKTLSEIREAG